MKNYLAIIFLLIMITSCSDIKIKDLNAEFDYSKTVTPFNLIEYNEYYNKRYYSNYSGSNKNYYYLYSSYTYDPDFFTLIKIKFNYDFKNKSGQNFEEFEITNMLELTYDNDFTQILYLSSSRNDSIFNDNEIAHFQDEVTINDLDSFKSEFLINKAKKVNLIFEIQATNSVGYDLKETGNNIVEFDITDKWNKVESFHRNKIFDNYNELEDNYMFQMISAIKIYEGWHNGTSQVISDLFEPKNNIFDRDKFLFTYTDLTDHWINIIGFYNQYFDKLFTSFYTDLEETNCKSNNKVKNQWDLWKKQRAEWVNADLEKILRLKHSFEKRDSIENLDIEYSLEKEILKQIKDSTAIIMNELEEDYSKQYKKAIGFFNSTMNELSAINSK